MYVLQLDHKSPNAWQFGVSWPGYYSGLGYVDDPKNAVHYPTRRDAGAAGLGIPVGLNGLLKVVPYCDMDREYGPEVK